MSDQKFLAQLGHSIRKQRTGRKLTQQQLASLCHLEKANLSRIESGKANPTIRTLLKLTAALNTRIQNLFPENEFAGDSPA